MLVHSIEPGGEDTAPVGHGTGAVDDDVVAPVVEGVAVGVGKRVARVETDLASPRLVAEDGPVGHASWRPPGRLRLRVVEGALLKIESACRIEGEAVGGVVGVGGVEAADDPLLDVAAVVAVGVFEIEHVRPLGHDHAFPPELKAGWVVEVIGKSLHAIGAAVAVGVFEDQQLVVHRLVGTPVRIGRPDGHPQPARGVEGHLHRVDQLGKLRFVGHQLHPHARVGGHLADRLVAGEEGMLAACELTGLVGLHVDQVRQADLVDRGERGLGVA